VEAARKLNGGPIPEVKFFNMDYITIGGQQGALPAPRHGRRAWARDSARMPSVKSEEVIAEAGKEFGWQGARAYATNTLESGWIPRRCRPVTGARSSRSIASGCRRTVTRPPATAGSFVSSERSRTTTTPYELGYGIMVKFDHDFISARRLEKRPRSRSARRSPSHGTPRTSPG
jgi:vanillate/3-O-methylgallate O-demethylase